MAIRLQFVCEAALSSQAIAWFSAGHFSHVDAVLRDGLLLGARSDRVGGKPPGVQIRPPNYAKWIRRTMMTVPATDRQTDDFYAFLLEQVGKPYDSAAIWAFVFNRDWRARDSWICSELQSAAGECAKLFSHPLYLAANKITPVSCALAYSAIGGTCDD
jgi:uncharacterized protein YycO